jgi:hypothetical protein
LANDELLPPISRRESSLASLTELEGGGIELPTINPASFPLSHCGTAGATVVLVRLLLLL